MANIYVVFQHIGYKRHPSIKNKLIIDEQVKDIVEKIFDMYANGQGSVEIVNFLNTNKYLSPTGYRKTGIIQDENKTNYDWNEVTLCNMLKNEVYIGNTVQNKKSVVSYKVHKIRTVEKENQIIVNNTHEPIVDKDTFEKVQCILKKRGCYPLSINYEKFEKHIIYVAKKICSIYADKEVFYSIYEKYQNKTLDIREGYRKKVDQIDKAIFDINNNLDKMYMDKLQGIILEEDYIRVSQKFIFDRTNLIKQKEELEQKLIGTEEKINTKYKTKEEKELDELIENFLKLEKIDKMYLYRLINKIEIDKDKNAYIFFNFSKLNSINENLDEFIKVEELINK